MAKQVINVGTSANDGTGDPNRTAFQKINANFTELYDGVGAGDLQQVTDNGNTTTNDIKVSKLYLKDSASELNGRLYLDSNNWFFEDSDGVVRFIATEGSIFLKNRTSEKEAVINTNLLTANRTYTLPDTSGTIALNSEIPTVDATPTDGSSNAVSSNGVFDALALKQDFAIDSFASTITFDVPKVYNSFSSPSSSNISQSLTGARIGVVQKFYSNKATEPTYPAGWVKLSGTYTDSVTNIIYAEWCEGSRVEYWIVKA